MDGESAVLDFSTMDTPSLDSAPVETSVETPVETPPEESLVETPETPVETIEKPESGKPAPLKAIRDAVKAFGEANPELGKHLKSLLDNEGRIRAYQETYADVDTARSVKAAIEAVGGLDGLAELSQLRDHVDDINAKWDSGDPAALETIFENGGEGAVKLFPHYSNRVEKANPEAFGNFIRPHLVRSLEGANFDGAMVALARLVADKPEAKEIVDSIMGWKNEQKRLSEKTNLDTLEPERKKLNEQATQLSQREYKQFEYEVNQEVKPSINQAFASRMSTYLKDDPRPAQAKQDIARAWLDELGKAMAKDQKQIETMMKSKSRNKAAIANFVRTRISAVADGVTKKIVDSYKLTPGKPGAKQPVKPGEQSPASSTVIKVAQKPADEQIDWDKDPDRMLFVSGRAYLKGSGKLVKWR